MGIRAIIFGELRFPPRQAAVWRGLTADPREHSWPEFFQGDERPSTVGAIFDACASFNEVTGPCFFFLDESAEGVRVRAWLDEEQFEPWVKRLAASCEAAHRLDGRGEFIFVGADDRRGIRMTLGSSIALDDILLQGEAEDHYSDALAEVFELSRGKLFGPSAVWIASPPTSDPHLGGKPLLSGLEFAEDQLFVSYRGSLDAQDLILSVETAEPFATDVARACLSTLMAAIEYGAAGGAHFSPSVGRAQALDPFPPPGEKLDELSFHLRVQGVAPRFLRFAIEHLRTLGTINLMAINGSLPLDGTELSVQEIQVGAWFSSATAYLEEWPNPGFRVVERSAMESVAIVTFQTPPSAKARARLEALVLDWIALLMPSLSKTMGSVDPRDIDLSAPFRWDTQSLAVRMGAFPFAPGPSRAVLVNMMSRYHESIEPIEQLELGLT